MEVCGGNMNRYHFDYGITESKYTGNWQPKNKEEDLWIRWIMTKINMTKPFQLDIGIVLSIYPKLKIYYDLNKGFFHSLDPIIIEDIEMEVEDAILYVLEIFEKYIDDNKSVEYSKVVNSFTILGKIVKYLW